MYKLITNGRDDNECSHISWNVILIKNNLFASLVAFHTIVHSNMITTLL